MPTPDDLAKLSKAERGSVLHAWLNDEEEDWDPDRRFDRLSEEEQLRIRWWFKTGVPMEVGVEFRCTCVWIKPAPGALHPQPNNAYRLKKLTP